MSQHGVSGIDREEIYRQLWPESTRDVRVFALLDAARDPDIERLIRNGGLEYDCLLAGELSRKMRSSAPYIVRLTPEAALTHSIIQRGWGQSWGVFALAWDKTLYDIRRHFRRFLRVKDESNRTLFFRYYDPRVLRAYLPTCTGLEVRRFFGPVALMMAESEGGDRLLAFRQRPEGVNTFAVPLTIDSPQTV